VKDPPGFPGAEDLLDRQAGALHRHAMIPRGNPCNLPFQSEFLQQPLAPLEQDVGKSPAHMPEAEESQVYLASGLNHAPEPSSMWAGLLPKSCSSGASGC